MHAKHSLLNSNVKIQIKMKIRVYERFPEVHESWTIYSFVQKFKLFYMHNKLVETLEVSTMFCWWF